MADQNKTDSPEVKVDGHALLEAMEQNGWELNGVRILHRETGMAMEFGRSLLQDKKGMAELLRELALQVPQIKVLVTSMASLPCTQRNGRLN